MANSKISMTIRSFFKLLCCRYHYLLPVCLLLLATNLHAANATPLETEHEAPESLRGALVINADDLQEMRADMSDLVIIDTRDAPNLTSTIGGAIHLTELDASPSTLLQQYPDKQTAMVFFGESAHAISSFKTARRVIGYGYVNVFWMRGGIEEWTAKGYPLGAFKQ